jgi:Uma2 family endonuclease
VLKLRDYRATLPRPEDTLLAVEVANTSLDYDRTVKLALYASNGIPEVWIVNLAAELVEVYRSPAGDGYTTVVRASRADVLTIEALPNVRIQVGAIFG